MSPVQMPLVFCVWSRSGKVGNPTLSLISRCEKSTQCEQDVIRAWTMNLGGFSPNLCIFFLWGQNFNQFSSKPVLTFPCFVVSPTALPKTKHMGDYKYISVEVVYHSILHGVGSPSARTTTPPKQEHQTRSGFRGDLWARAPSASKIFFMQFSGNCSCLSKIWAQGPPLGSKLRWAPWPKSWIAPADYRNVCIFPIPRTVHLSLQFHAIALMEFFPDTQSTWKVSSWLSLPHDVEAVGQLWKLCRCAVTEWFDLLLRAPINSHWAGNIRK